MRNRPHPLQAVILRLEEHAHDLSNSVGMTMNLLVLGATGDREAFPARLEAATEQAMRAVGVLQMLMAELHRLRALAAQEQGIFPEGGGDQDG